MKNKDNVFGDLSRGLAALAALLGLVVGVPVGLLNLAGWPLPHSLPRWSAVVHALSQSQIADSTIVKFAALICWMAWLVLVVCVVVEVAAWVAGRTAARLPVIGPFQVWAGRLVATALLLFSSFGGLVRPASAAPMPTRTAAVRVQQQPRLRVIHTGEPSPQEAAVAAAPALPEPPGAKRYVVQPPEGRRRDTLWAIADRHLGNPERWPEVFELNKDRFSSGHRLTNPHWIYPGEELVMPADAVGVDVAPSAPAASGAVAPSPDAPAPLSAPAASPSTPTTAPQSSVDMRVVPDNESQPEASGKGSGWHLAHDLAELVPVRLNGSDLAGAGVLAAGVVFAVDRRRRTRQRRHRPGRPLLVPNARLAAMELAARVGADPEGAELVQIGLQLLAARAPETSDVLGVRLAPRHVELTFTSDPGSLPAPFRRTDGDRWMLPARLVGRDVRDEAAAHAIAIPPLVTVGRTDGGGEVLLNLRAAGHSTIVGDRTTALDLLHAAASELANRPWDQPLDVVLVGFGEALAGMPGVRAVASLASVIDGLGHDAVVLVAGDVVEELPPGVAALAFGSIPGDGRRIVVAPGSVEVEALGVVVCPPHVSVEDAIAIAQLVTPPEPVELGADEVVDQDWPAEPESEPRRESDVPDDEGTEPEPKPAAAAPEPAPAPAPAPAPSPEPSHSLQTSPQPAAAEVEVRVLGPVEIAGGEKPLARAKSIELLVYLAMHRSAVVDADRLREALWPGRPPGTTLYTTASVARNHLGKSAAGDAHFPLLPGGERVYKLASSVGSDYDRFTGRVRRAQDEAPAEAIVSLRAALELVRGRPFEVASRGYEWAHVEGFISMIENEVAGAAHQLAQLYLEAGDAEGARWATRQGLRVSPGNEQLFRDEMFAADLQGNRAGVESVLNELTHIVEDDAPFDCLHPETVAVYKRLTSGERLVPTG
jgi:DNA-binding SARP family transcriptional activator